MTLETKLQIEVLKLLEDKHLASWYAEDKKYIYITTESMEYVFRKINFS